MPIDRAMLKGLTRRELEEAKAAIEAELVSCVLCGTEGADPYGIRGPGPDRRRAAILLCLPCFERNRIPEGRASG